MKYITKGNPNLNSLHYKINLTNGNIKMLRGTCTLTVVA